MRVGSDRSMAPVPRGSDLSASRGRIYFLAFSPEGCVFFFVRLTNDEKDSPRREEGPGATAGKNRRGGVVRGRDDVFSRARRPLSGRSRRMGPISDPAALSIVWRAALGVLVPGTSMRPFISVLFP